LVTTHTSLSEIWKQSDDLDRMTLRSHTDRLLSAPRHLGIFAFVGFSGAPSWWRPSTLAHTTTAMLEAMLLYPLIWCGLPRRALHGRWMFKSPPAASARKRIHFFGALYTTLPTIALATMPVGWLTGGLSGATAAFAIGLLITCAYEYIHCIEHLPHKPRSKMLAVMNARHLAHHFHDENGNYGITDFLWDRLFGVLYDRSEHPFRSPTVYNLGYAKEVAQICPWVAQLSGGVASDRPRRTRQ
jgi:sterol desaturase/sphingolipid hydroxylase (fatty acid hydroxylase superfamily)